MKKISILLMSVLFILAVSCSSPSNPDNNNNNNNNNIALSERAGTYSGTMNGLELVIVLNNNAQVTSIKVGGNESITDPIVIKEGASYKGTSISEFDATVNMVIPMSAKVRIEFKSGTDASQGATAYVTIQGSTTENPVDLTYSK